MSVLMKKPLTKVVKMKSVLMNKIETIESMNILSMLNSIIDKLSDGETVSAESVFPILNDKTKLKGLLLKSARLNAGLTQLEVALKLRIKQSNLSAIENNKREIGLGLAKRLAKMYKTDFRLFL